MDKSLIPFVLIFISLILAYYLFTLSNEVAVWIFWGVFMYFLGVFTFSPFFMEDD